MGAFDQLRRRIQPIAPPTPADTFQGLDRAAVPVRRRVKSGRTEQFNARVTAEYLQRVRLLAEANKDTIGGLLEAMLILYESGARAPQQTGIPVAEARAGRTRQLRVYATDQVLEVVGKVAAERRLTVSGLIEDLLAREVEKLDPRGDRLGVVLKR